MNVQKVNELYCFDASAFITLSRTDERVIQIPESVWTRLAKLMEEGVIISHQLVFDEISSQSKNPDFIAKWVADKQDYFLPRTDAQKEIVPDIVRKFPHLIDFAREKEQADPWLIALAIEKERDTGIFHKTEATIVSQENPESSKKIPAVCKKFDIKHLSLRGFFDKMGMGTKLSSK
jgi:Domain of unknown function (DUF4411)